MVLCNDNGAYLGRAWFFHDITVQKQNEAALVQLARHDPLTGTANRRYFSERAQQEFSSPSVTKRRGPSPVSMLIISS